MANMRTRNRQHAQPTKEGLVYEIVKLYIEKISAILSFGEQQSLDKLIQNLMKICEVCATNSEMVLFLEILILIGKYAFEIGQLDKSAFFFNQCLIYIDLTRKFEYKARILQYLSKICREYHDFPTAIKMLKKALQYSWESANLTEEIEIYEEIGICYYYMGEIETAQFYHQKFVSGDTEKLDSPNRQMSLNDLIICRRKLIYNFNTFNKIIFYQLQLPIKNVDQLFVDRDFIEEKVSQIQNSSGKSKVRSFLLQQQEKYEQSQRISFAEDSNDKSFS